MVAHQVQVLADGDSVGIALTEELLARLDLQKGDAVYLTETPTGAQITRETHKTPADTAESAHIPQESPDYTE